MTKGNKYAKALQDSKYRQRVVSGKRRRVPYWSAKEVMDNDWKVDGLDPMGYYDEIIEYENSCDDPDCQCRSDFSWPDNVKDGCSKREGNEE